MIYNKINIKNFFIAIFLICFLILISEIALRFSSKLKTYTEKNFGVYQSPYIPSIDNHLYTFNINDTIKIQTLEYNFNYLTNSQGFLSKEIKNKDEIVVLGDSFTFGSGAPKDSSFVKLLENLFKNDSCVLGFTNAGIPGSDPFFQKKIMNEIFLPLGHKTFIFVINISDIYDYIFRGDEERFLENGKLKYANGPWYNTIYKYSYLFRGFLHGFVKADYSLLNPKQLNLKKEEAVYAYLKLFTQIQNELNEKGGELLVVSHPYPLNYDTTFTKNWSVGSYIYIKKLNTLLLENSINVIDLKPKFDEVLSHVNYLNYSWEIDGHFNSIGYDLFAKILHKELKTNNILIEYCP